MTWVASAIEFLGPVGTAIAGSSLLNLAGGAMQSGAAKEAAQTQLQGAQYGADIQKQMFDVLNAQQAPYRQAGYGALTKIQDMLPFFTKMPTAEDIKGIPGYQFGLEQGLGAVSQAGNVLSPGSNVDLARQKFGTDYALTKALPAYLAQRTDIYNTLANIAGIGQKSTDVTSQLGQATGTNLAQLATGGATALAGGQVGSANAMANALGNIGNAGFLYSLMQKPGGTGGTPISNMMGPVYGAQPLPSSFAQYEAA